MKTKKLFLAIFLALFLIPELLWSSTFNYLLGIFQSGYVFRDTSFWSWGENKFLTIYSIQVASLLGIAILSFLVANSFQKRKRTITILLGLVAFLLFLVSSFFLLVGLAFGNFTGI